MYSQVFSLYSLSLHHAHFIVRSRCVMILLTNYPALCSVDHIVHSVRTPHISFLVLSSVHSTEQLMCGYCRPWTVSSGQRTPTKSLDHTLATHLTTQCSDQWTSQGTLAAADLRVLQQWCSSAQCISCCLWLYVSGIQYYNVLYSMTWLVQQYIDTIP